jgi:ribosomal protein S18 acetylase RimI-like enzyme
VQALNNPIWSALTGPHAGFAHRGARAARYDTSAAIFGAVEDPADPDAWESLRPLIAEHGPVILAAPGLAAPEGWTLENVLPGFQYVGEDFHGRPDPEAEVMGAADVPAMLELTARTRPGPFFDRTVELGTYLGIRREGRLVALAGERMHLDGYTEISAVCTDPAFQGAGLATRLIGAVAHTIRARGEVPMLHVAHTNDSAIRLYDRLGFSRRTGIVFGWVM